MERFIMAIDAGTTGIRCILFDREGRVRSTAHRSCHQTFPRDGWVEMEGAEIWSGTLACVVEAMARAEIAGTQVAAVGITNQRETVLAWERATGTVIGPAIVWQCRRTAADCEALIRDGKGPLIREKTGLWPDAYFSATKLRWMMENVPGLAKRAKAGEICFGTVDSYLLYRLSGCRVHATDVSNASRTMLFNIHTLCWDAELLELFGIPAETLPEVKPSSGYFGETDLPAFGAAVPVLGIAGDQQAALFGQCCFAEGMVKNTYGTGCFLLMNTGAHPLAEENGLLSTVAWQIGDKVTYALEGSVFICGAAVQWLRDGMRLLESEKDSAYMAGKVPDCGGVYVVPAFSGLGAPYWDPYARGLVIGITRATNKYHLIRATLEAMAYQTADVLGCMEKARGGPPSALRVDGGASTNDLLLQFQADILHLPVQRPACIESTARGAAYLAGLAASFWPDFETLEGMYRNSAVFSPQMPEEERTHRYALWRKAVERAMAWKE